MLSPVNLCEVAGMELEYVLADPETLKIRPVADKLLTACGEAGVAPALVSHVIRVGYDQSPADLPALYHGLATLLEKIWAQCRNLGLVLLPTGMHPLMNPLHETNLWHKGDARIYALYHRIFNCHRHGWANIQHSLISFPFQGDEDFVRLHSALRVLLPLLPALAASSPVMDGKISPCLDQRLVVYGQNQSRIPCITGDVIPESVGSMGEYREKILAPIARVLRPLDPEGLLQAEFVNSRGAVARFERSVLELRILDTQEATLADCAIAALVSQILQKLVQETWSSLADQRLFPQARLKKIYTNMVRQADNTPITDADYLALFGIKNMAGLPANSLLWNLFHQCVLPDPFVAVMETLLARGTLASRLVQALGSEPSREDITDVYNKLSRCLAEQTLFIP